ncbi:MAG TPA: phage head closure protein [Devosia sp.]|jgi:SPP1 family predicted phage head-tail adaptor|nr:phage head closure protein [Devosia sp.]
MRAGDLDREVRLLRFSITYNDDNEPIEGWTPDASPVWASVQYASDGEKARAGQVGAVVSIRFQIRWSASASTLNAKDRVIYEGGTFDIAGIKELGRREGLEISGVAAADE